MINYIRKFEGKLIKSIESISAFSIVNRLSFGRYIKVNKFIGFFQKLFNAYKITNLVVPIDNGLKNNKDYIKIKIAFNA